MSSKVVAPNQVSIIGACYLTTTFIMNLTLNPKPSRQELEHLD